MNFSSASFLKYAAPLMWAAVFFSTMMLLSFYDAESFFVSFVLLALGVLGLVWALPKEEPFALSKSPFLYLLLGFWGLAFVSVVFSHNPFTSFIFFCFLGMMPLGFVYAGLVPDKDQFFRVIFKIGAGLYAVLALACLAQYFLLPEFLVYGITQYPFGNPNSLAGFLSLGLFCVYGAMIKAPAQSGRTYLLFGLALLMFAAMLTTGSRGGFVALLAGGAVFALMMRRRLGAAKFLHLSFVALAGSVFYALTAFAPEGYHQTPVIALAKSVQREMPILWDRPYIWGSTWEIIRDHFWTGTGVGTFHQVYPAYRTFDKSTAGHMAHNDVLQFWSEMGVFSPLIFCALVGFAIYKTVRVFRILPPEDERRIMIAAVFCAFGAMVLHTQISFHFYVLPILFTAGTMLGYWFSQVERVEPSGVWQVSEGSVLENMLVKFCLSALILCCGFIFVRFQSSEILVDMAKHRIEQGNIPGFFKGVNDADALAFGRNARALALASTVPSGVVRGGGAQIKPDEIFKMIVQAEDLLDRALAANPYLASAYHEKAMVAQLALQYVPQAYSEHHNGHPPDVRALMEQSLHYNPLHAATRLKLAEMMIAQGEEEAAYEVLKDGLRWRYKGTTGLALYQKLVNMAIARGDTETRDMAMHQIKRIYVHGEYVKKRMIALDKKFGPLSVWKIPE